MERRTVGYDPATLTPLQNYKLLCGAVVPRPIAWVSCLSPHGVPNIAPFSFFNIVSSNPPMLGFSVSKSLVPGKGDKDTLTFVRANREFVVNIPTAELLDELVITSIEYAPDVDEFDAAGLTALPGERIAVPRIAEAPVSFECLLHSAIDLGASTWVMGTVVYAHFREGLVAGDCKPDPDKLRPLGRMPGPTFSTEMNVVPRSASLADPAAGLQSSVVWQR
ncbi:MULTISPECIES: flavin reductase family protein [unclassified Amycolatopsis]|uniref:flavin reductase family protein n=1 Tax=unclassified Amycolatopsis TaxID=2618356 RepID=UPI001C6971E5|nr:flavin reductase family protein [Amycolatopsis sp. DSM 110486]QYN20234.1 flavin reductase family protein [Amycolatopsis sp. DSM 110486]